MTKLHSLTLGITIPAKLPKNMEEARKVTGSFVIAQKAVLGEKGKACGFCGFTSNSNKTYPTDGNFREVSVDRLKPVCPHCNAYQIGRASCRERGCQYGVDLGGRRIIKKKKKRKQ